MHIRRVERIKPLSSSTSHQPDETLEASKIAPGQDLQRNILLAADLEARDSVQQDRKVG